VKNLVGVLARGSLADEIRQRFQARLQHRSLVLLCRRDLVQRSNCSLQLVSAGQLSDQAL
jgi:hypothetical protein